MTRVAFCRVQSYDACVSKRGPPASPFARQSTAEDARGEESRERADASVMANATDPLAKSVRGWIRRCAVVRFDETPRTAAERARERSRARARERESERERRCAGGD